MINKKSVNYVTGIKCKPCSSKYTAPTSSISLCMKSVFYPRMKNTSEKINKGEIVIYQTSKKEVELKVRFEDETVWLDTHQIALLFGVNRPAIVKHINNIYSSRELDRGPTCSILEQVAADGKIRRKGSE